VNSSDPKMEMEIVGVEILMSKLASIDFWPVDNQPS
jgi:hypothetical protein